MIFDENGHLTAQAINSFKKNELPSNELLLFADHISSCDKCSLVLSDSFDESDLFNVPLGFSEEVVRRAYPKNDDRKQLVFYSLRVAFAASIALVILFSGTLNRLSTSYIEYIPTPDNSYVDNINTSLRDFSQKLLNLEVLNNEKKEK